MLVCTSRIGVGIVVFVSRSASPGGGGDLPVSVAAGPFAASTFIISEPTPLGGTALPMERLLVDGDAHQRLYRGEARGGVELASPQRVGSSHSAYELVALVY